MNYYYLQNTVVQSSDLCFSFLLGQLLFSLCAKRDEISSLLPLLSGSLVSVGCCKSERNEREVL